MRFHNDLQSLTAKIECLAATAKTEVATAIFHLCESVHSKRPRVRAFAPTTSADE